MNLTNNTILITGGGSGIGRELAIYLHNKGSKVIVSGRRGDLLQTMTKEFAGMDFVVLDVADKNSIATVCKELLAKYPTLNGLIHNAGLMTLEKIGESPVDEAEKIIDTNLTSVIRLNAELLPTIKSNPNPFVMTTTSGLAFIPNTAFATYNATKAALHSYTQSMRSKLDGVHIIELIPPYVQTTLISEAQATDPNAMPLKDFMDQVIEIIEANPNVDEIKIEKVKWFTDTVNEEIYNQRFASMNG